LINLLSNALKFSNHKQTVKVIACEPSHLHDSFYNFKIQVED